MIHTLYKFERDRPSHHKPVLTQDNRYAWILEAVREIRTVRKVGIDLINFHANLNGMFYGEKRKILLDNLTGSPREIIRYAEKSKVHAMLENVPLKNHLQAECKTVTDF
jgi:hypothetical protein